MFSLFDLSVVTDSISGNSIQIVCCCDEEVKELHCRVSVVMSEWSSEDGGFRRLNSLCTVLLYLQCISS